MTLSGPQAATTHTVALARLGNHGAQVTAGSELRYNLALMGAPREPEIIGRYAVYGKIASGGMASVHYGRMVGAAGFARTVAIKRLHPHLVEEPEFTSTLIDEARLAARIQHPNVVPTLDVVATGTELLVIMEHVRGESLSKLVRAMNARGRRVPLPIVSAIALGALQGLHAAHEATSDRGKPLGVVHRDVSPQNILVGIDGVARIIDFGVAKAAGRLQTTQEGVVKGKLGYMAPEQLEAVPVTRRADVYAMAVVLWEMLTGRRLFSADNDAKLVTQVLAGARVPPSHIVPELPAGVDALVMAGLAVDPEDRFGTALEMAEMLALVIPPALPTVVGAWVEDTASEALAQRGLLLAEIESNSGIASVHPQSAKTAFLGLAGPAGKAETGREETQTAVSQASSLSVETPSPSGAAMTRAKRRALAAAAGLLVAAVAVASLVRSSRTLPAAGRAGETITADIPRDPPVPTRTSSTSELAPTPSGATISSAVGVVSSQPPPSARPKRVANPPRGAQAAPSPVRPSGTAFDPGSVR
jgi:serine/threonine-protein kinase